MNIFKKVLLRVLQVVALHVPGATTTRVKIHRLRGVKIGEKVFIGTNVHFDSSYPEKIFLGNNVEISMNVLVLSHFREIGKKMQ
ncbi:MAG: hypothetical protein HY965_00340 [Ignavibacteriales bacterium]|nr:hypothetical protein [Ignavibacteriales bacterium]